jgi:hypothetical protein
LGADALHSQVKELHHMKPSDTPDLLFNGSPEVQERIRESCRRAFLEDLKRAQGKPANLREHGEDFNQVKRIGTNTSKPD